MIDLKMGSKAPAFTLKNQLDEKIKLSNFLGQKVILYFYPKASTPGCTTQACELRDVSDRLKHENAVVLAVSPDPVSKLAKFADKYDLNFQLLSDEDHSVCEKYGVWRLKKFMGREFMGVVRTTFIIGEDGKILRIMNKVNTKTHHDDVLVQLG